MEFTNRKGTVIRPLTAVIIACYCPIIATAISTTSTTVAVARELTAKEAELPLAGDLYRSGAFCVLTSILSDH